VSSYHVEVGCVLSACTILHDSMTPFQSPEVVANVNSMLIQTIPSAMEVHLIPPDQLVSAPWWVSLAFVNTHGLVLGLQCRIVHIQISICLWMLRALVVRRVSCGWGRVDSVVF
jgi:hypothetical protein